jgi:phosphate transport system protein
VQIALVGRYFERVADHAVNVAERVCFMVTGEFRHPEG